MRDYNLRSRDIYGEPQQGGGRGWLKVVVVLVVAAAAAAGYLQFRQYTPAQETSSPETRPAGETSRDIIPLTLPPRSTTQTPGA
jgi:hypothetical protein